MTNKRIEMFKELNLENEVLVIRIIDGDTIQTDVGRIRLLGIDTPEKGNTGYEEATDFLKFLIGKIVRHERDEENLDRGGLRKLRYIFYQNRLINAEIIKRGLGKLFMYEGLIYENELKGG